MLPGRPCARASTRTAPEAGGSRSGGQSLSQEWAGADATPSAGLSGFQEFFPLLSSNLLGTWSIASSPLSANLVQVAKDVPGLGLRTWGSSVLRTSERWAAWARAGHSLGCSLGHSGPPSSSNALLCCLPPLGGLPLPSPQASPHLLCSLLLRGPIDL